MMFNRFPIRAKSKIGALLFLFLGACGLVSRCTAPDPIDQASFDAVYANPTPSPKKPLIVYHLGHSLVGKDMPLMLQQLAGEGHEHSSQLGWGSFLRQHWEIDVPINGYAEENTHPQHRDPHEALASGGYDALILTEAVEIRDAIKYFTPHDYLRKFATAAWAKNPDIRVYLYETWHPLDDPEGWLDRLDLDLERYWEGEILRRALAYDNVTQPIYVIPAGQVMAAFVREVEKRGGVGPIKDRHDLFSDDIHFNDYGAYLVALTHYAVLYAKSPLDLPHNLIRADGTPAANPGEAAARLMQRVVWDVVASLPETGVTR